MYAHTKRDTEMCNAFILFLSCAQWIAYIVLFAACLQPRPIYMKYALSGLLTTEQIIIFPLCDQHFVHLFA